MKLAELYTEAARVAKMIEPYPELRFGDVVKVFGEFIATGVYFTKDPESYTFALAIVEGKPVFVGDELYDPYERRCRVTGLANDNCIIGDGRAYHIWSWNPPQPKTVLIELLVEDAKRVRHTLDLYEVPIAINRAKCVFDKALEQLP